MILLCRSLLRLQKTSLLHSCRPFCKKTPEIKSANALRFNLKPSIRAYTSFTLCAAGAAAAFSFHSNNEIIKSSKEPLETLPSPTSTLNTVDDHVRVDILSLSTICSLILSDIPYFIFAVLVC